MKVDLTLYFKDIPAIMLKRVEIEESMTAIVVYQTDTEWSKIPLVALNYYDVKVVEQ